MNFHDVPARKRSKLSKVSFRLEKTQSIKSIAKSKVKSKAKKATKVVTPLMSKFETAILPTIEGLKLVEIEKSKQLPFGVDFTTWKGKGRDAISLYKDKFGYYPTTVFHQAGYWFMTNQDVSTREVSLEPILPVLWHSRGSVKPIKLPKPPKPIRHLPVGKVRIGKTFIPFVTRRKSHG